MKKKILLLCLFCLFGQLAYSQKIFEKILQVDKEPQFENYQGDLKYSDSDAVIMNIGSQLARKATKNNTVYFQDNNKYSIIRAIDLSISNKLDADILSIEKNARIKHINAVRLILSGYLQSRYQYSAKSANTLALYITYYNAVHRGNMEYFGKIYKSVVLSNVTAENAGIGLSYKEWAGKTKIVIPVAQDIDLIDTSELSEDLVLVKMKEDKTNVLSEREDMTKVKKEELAKREEDLKRSKEELEKRKEELTVVKDVVESKKEGLERKKEIYDQLETDIADLEKQLLNTKDPEERKKILEKIQLKKNELAKVGEEIRKEEEEVARREEEVRKKEEEVRRQNELVKAKEEKIEEKKEEIKKEETALRNDRGDNVVTKPDESKPDTKPEDKKDDKTVAIDKPETVKKDVREFYYLRVKNYFDKGQYHNELLIIDAAEKKILKKSPLTNISGKQYNEMEEGVLVIALTNEKDQDRLTLLSKKTLKPVKWGKEAIFWRSFIEVRAEGGKNYVYAILIDKNEVFYLGKFDSDLKLVAKSKTKVHRDSFIAFYDKYVYINDEKKRVVALNREDLEYAGRVD